MGILAVDRQGRQEAAMAHFEKGLKLYHDGKVDEAIVELRQAVRLDGRNARAQFTLAECLDRKNLADEAILHYREGLKTDGNNATAHFEFGNLLFRSGRVNDAIRQFMITLIVNPQYVSARYMLACCLEKKGLIAEALQEYRYILKTSPNLTEPRISSAQCMERLGRNLEAIGEYRAALESDPGRVDVRATLARLLEREGLIGDAIEEYRFITGQDPENIDFRLRLAGCLDRKGLIAEAIREYSAILRMSPENRAAASRLEKIRQDHARLSAVADRYFAIVAECSPEEDALFKRGVSLYVEGGYDDAIACFGYIADAAGPSEARAHFAGSLALIRKGVLDAAESGLKKAAWARDDFAEAHFLLGLLHERQGLLYEAFQAYGEALKHQPDLHEAKVRLRAVVGDQG
ncbi:tetratricopeptide repeat protein [Methanocella arvoryzae]|uniref:Uncharacterized protein n=1 Tax=Methanocella arvoryzae (strain DSM 22066 / NBRC 105507 / MRE50) TaxID=351160 RepID=Q0W8Z0_METAR|nr:tetratricopeptide repeat protein [Methanocella arvoryzae]CAJ35136.1 hypothetical protein LRC117 [Methanocella arvoryzae MRE50]